MTVRQALVSQERICQGTATVEKDCMKRETEGIQAGTEQGGTGGDTEGEEADMITTYTKPNQPDPKVRHKGLQTTGP